MARVKQEVIEEAKGMIKDLPYEHVATCGLCSRTLFDNLSVIANKTGVPEKTVAYKFADHYNVGKREEEQITGNAFYERLKHLHRSNKQDLKSDFHPIKDSSEEPKEDTELPQGQTAQPLKSDFHPINLPIEQTEDDKYCVDFEQTLPLDLKQEQLVYMLCKFFDDKHVSPDGIYRTFQNTMHVLFPTVAEQMRKGNKVLPEDLPKVIGSVLQKEPQYASKISEVILEGLTEYSKLTAHTVKNVVQLMNDSITSNNDVEEDTPTIISKEN